MCFCSAFMKDATAAPAELWANSTFDEWAKRHLMGWKELSSSRQQLIMRSRNPEDLSTEPGAGASHIWRGIYYRTLEAWFATWPRSQFAVLNFHELTKRDQSTLQTGAKRDAHVLPSAIRFVLGALPIEAGERLIRSLLRVADNATMPHVNSKKDAASSAPTTCETLDLLGDFYEPYNELLYQLLGSTSGLQSWDVPFGRCPQPRVATASSRGRLCLSATPGGAPPRRTRSHVHVHVSHSSWTKDT